MESSDNTSANNTTSSSQSQALSKYWCFMCERDFSHPDTESAEVFCPQCNCISEKIEDSNDPRTFKPFDAQKEAPQNTQPAQNSQTNNPTNNRTQPPQPNAPIMGFNVIYHTSPMPMQPFTLHNPFAQGIPNMGMPNFGNIPPQANQNQQGIPNQNPNPPLANLFNPFLNNALNMMNQFFTGNPLQANMFGDIEGRIIEEFLRNDPNRHGPPPAPQESINKLKKSQFGETCKVKDCSVCQDDYKTGDELLTMPCDHIFHKACLEKWLGMHNSCPSCRKPLGPARDSYSENMFA